MTRARRRRLDIRRGRYTARCLAIGAVPAFGPYGRFWRSQFRQGVLYVIRAKANGKITELSERLAAMHETDGYKAMWFGPNPS